MVVQGAHTSRMRELRGARRTTAVVVWLRRGRDGLNWLPGARLQLRVGQLRFMKAFSTAFPSEIVTLKEVIMVRCWSPTCGRHGGALRRRLTGPWGTARCALRARYA